MIGVNSKLNEVTKYHNDLNTVIMRRWTKEEMNFFFAIIAKSRDKENTTIVFQSDELQGLTHFSGDYNKRWNDTMDRVTDKVAQLIYTERTSQKKVVMTLFSKFEVDFKQQTITVKISENFQYILNQIQANFTSFELEEFTRIRSTYAKTSYRILKQWRTQGIKEFSLEEFKELLDIPKSYAQSDINKRVIKPIKEELSKCFTSLNIVPIKSKTRGNPVTGYRFTWKAEKTGEWKDFSKKLKPKKSEKPTRQENVPDSVKEAEQAEIDRQTILQQNMFKRAVDLRSKPLEEKYQLFTEARNMDTYRMPDSANFLTNLALFMNLDIDQYWSEYLGNKNQTED